MTNARAGAWPGFSIRGNTTIEGPKVPSEAWRREAPEHRGGGGLGRGAVALPQYGPGVWGVKLNFEIVHFPLVFGR